MAAEQTLKNLQTALSMELSAVHQYQLHAAVLDDWGMNLLADQMRSEMQEELTHSQRFLARIFFHHGSPVMELEKTPVQAKSLREMFKADLSDEQAAIQFYATASRQASEDGDIGSKALFEEIAIDEEGHSSWLELQLDLLERIGESAYIAKQISTPGGQE